MLESLLENIFPFLVIIVIIITSLLKRKKPAQKEKDASQKPSLWKQVIGEIMDQIEEKKEAQEIKIRKHFPEPEPTEEFLLDEEESEPMPLRGEIQVSQPPPIKKIARPKKSEPFVPGTPVEKKTEPSEFDISTYSVQELEKVIVLSEIIGPPLAVRRDQEERIY